MALDEIPQFHGGASITKSSKKKTGKLWLYLILAAFLIFDAVIAIYYFSAQSSRYGGLDGCFLTSDGIPLEGATVKVGETSTTTYIDGCFFFAELPAGRSQLMLAGNSGEIVFTQEVEIPADQALGLGSITLP
ncbi:MAG: carboxypeptidase regulatory-like domain-containing protein [Anaerolineales bacterium]|nr:carboxypeptidase regulatory-like domain-containing protein [Anaerolineales bacterium]MCB9145467.1 carboxypeptidase regulatory-like domain-containing protein [Anaerolineales bacterium]